MGSSSEKTLSYSGTPADAFAAAEQALTAIGAKVMATDPVAGSLTATKGESFVSRGESITVRVEQVGDGCALHLRSESQEEIDWGRNAANIAQFEQMLTGGSTAPAARPASREDGTPSGSALDAPALAGTAEQKGAQRPEPASLPSIFGP